MTPPRVLYLSGWQLGAHGEGAASFVYEQIEALAHDVEAVYVEHRFDGAISWARRRVGRADIEAINDLWPPPPTALRLWTPRLPPRLTKRDLLDDIWKAGGLVASRIARLWGRIDLVHAHVVLPAGLLGAAISRALGAPLLIQEHSAPFSMHLDTDVKRAAVRRTLASAAIVCAVGSDLAGRLADHGAPAVRLTPNLVRTGLFSPTPIPDDRDQVRIVSVGALEERKGFDILLDAVALLQRSGLQVRLRIIGSGSLYQTLRDRIAELSLDPEATLVGARSRAETASIMAASHMYVCSSHHETFGIAPAEAISIGRPVVSTRCGGPETFVDGTCGTLVDRCDPHGLADGIRSIWHRLGDFAPTQMHASIDRRFGPDAFRNRMLGLYEEARYGRLAA